MITNVYEFNKNRNGLELDLVLELNMLREEIREFWDAVTVAERLDALIDTEYTWFGTQMKASYHTESIEVIAPNIERSIKLMREFLKEELGGNYGKCYEEAKVIVCRANALKSYKRDENGKVIKGDIENATKSIALMIEAITKPTNY